MAVLALLLAMRGSVLPPGERDREGDRSSYMRLSMSSRREYGRRGGPGGNPLSSGGKRDMIEGHQAGRRRVRWLSRGFRK